MLRLRFSLLFFLIIQGVMGWMPPIRLATDIRVFVMEQEQEQKTSLKIFTTTYSRSLSKILSAVMTAFSFQLSPVRAASDLPSLETCFNAIKKEIAGSESLKRIEGDIEAQNWEDLKKFTREYDAGFRGGVLKSVWKQLDGDSKRKGIDISNSFTFDLIALNKAARNHDDADAKLRLRQVRQDLIDFAKLEDSIPLPKK